jgi:hypothetical protein
MAMVTEPQDVFGAATRPLHPDRNAVRTRHGLLTSPALEKRKKRKKSAHRGSLSLDNWGPHKGSAWMGHGWVSLLLRPPPRLCRRLLDDHVGLEEKRRGDRHPERLRRLQIDD